MTPEEKIKDMLSKSNRPLLIDTLIKLIFEELTDRNIFYYYNRYNIGTSNYEGVCYNMCRYVIKEEYPYKMRIDEQDINDLLLLNGVDDILEDITVDDFNREFKKRKTI